MEGTGHRRQVVLTRQHDHWDSGGPVVCSQRLEDLEAVKLGHQNVEQNNVREDLRRHFETGEAFGSFIGHVTIVTKKLRRERPCVPVIFDYEYLCHCCHPIWCRDRLLRSP